MVEPLPFLFFNESVNSLFNLTDDVLFDSTETIFLSSIRPYSPELTFLLAVIGIFTSILTISGNVLVLVSFLVDRQIRQPTNYFILSLAISDFLIGCISMPFLTLTIYKNQWVLGSFLCDIWLSLDYTACLASIYTVLLITVDRFCSVKIPAKYRNWRTKRRIIYLVLLTWLIPALIFFISTMGYPLYSKKSNLSPTDLQCDVQWNKNAYFNLGLTVAYFWVTLLVMFTLYFFIYQVARALEKRSKENAQKLSNIMSTSSHTADVIVNMSKKNHRLTHTTISSFSRSKKSRFSTKQSSFTSSTRRHGSIDEEPASLYLTQNGVDMLNRSSSNETSGEHASVATIAPNLTNLLSITRVGVEVLKPLDENRTLLSSLQMKTVAKTKAQHRNSSSKARKALRTITVIMGAFVLCWTPWHIHTIIQTFCQTCRESIVFNTYLYHVCYFLCYLNSPINPFCYALANRQFKKTYKRLLRCDFRHL